MQKKKKKKKKNTDYDQPKKINISFNQAFK